MGRLMSIRAAILGASGFAGAELMRLLLRHPEIELVGAAGSSKVGKEVSSVYGSLRAYRGMRYLGVEEALELEAEIVFSSLPHTESMKFFDQLDSSSEFKVVDIGADFRLRDSSAYAAWYGVEHSNPKSLSNWVYGLTELHREEIKGATLVANPGCYPAAALLALAPLMSAGAISRSGIHVDAKSGVSGSGRAGGEGFDFASVNENVRAYKVTGHNHTPEIEQELSLIAGTNVNVTFVPHLVPMTRGIFATCLAEATTSADDQELSSMVRDFYQGEPFVRAMEPGNLPETKRLSGSNLAEVAVKADKRTGRVIAMSALDNLGKGAAGQALQNANLMLGFEETTALDPVSWGGREP